MIPDYEKMKYLVGKNKLLYDIYKSIYNENIKLIIINNKYSPIIDLNELIDIIIEYFKERINLIYYEGSDLDIFSSDLNLIKQKTQEIPSNLNNENLCSIKSSNSSENLNYKRIYFKYFEKINIKNKDELLTYIIREKKESNTFFINISSNDLINMFLDYYEKNELNIKSKIILFLNGDIEKINKIKTQIIELNNLKQEDYNIKYQRLKINKTKVDFNNFIKEEMAGNKDILPLKVDKEFNIKYEILFLFSCFNSDIIQGKELYMIFDNKNNSKFNENKIKDEFNNIKIKGKSELKKCEDSLLTEIKKGASKENLNKEYQNLSQITNSILSEINNFLIKNNIYLYELKDQNNEIKDYKKELGEIISEINKKLKENIKEYNFNFKELKEKIEKFNFITINKIIEESLNIIIIIKLIDQNDNKKDKKTEITYKKINKNNNFCLYYNNWKMKITEQIQKEILEILFFYYSKMFRLLIKKGEKIADINTESFKIIENFGQLLGINNTLLINDKDESNFYIFNIKNKNDAYKLCKHLVYNFIEILKIININLLKKDQEIWDKVKFYLEDLSITYYSCLKIFEIDIIEFRHKIGVFKELFKHDSTLYARLIFMIWVFYHDLNKLDKFDFNIKIEEQIFEEEILNRFSEQIADIDKNPKYLEKIEKKELQNLNQNRIINVFINSVKFYFYRFNIKNRKLNDNLKNNISNIAKIFKKEKFKIWEIRIYLLIAYFHLEKYNINNNINDKEGFYNYLMFSYYVSDYYKTDFNEIIKSFDKLRKKINENDKLNCENIKNICNEFSYEYKIDKNLENIFYMIRQI